MHVDELYFDMLIDWHADVVETALAAGEVPPTWEDFLNMLKDYGYDVSPLG